MNSFEYQDILGNNFETFNDELIDQNLTLLQDNVFTYFRHEKHLFFKK